MRGIVLILLCAITFAHGRELLIRDRKLCTCNPSDSNEICANWDLEDIIIAHERCDKFYKCVYGKPVPYCCSRGLVYNTAKDTCDWPANVECGNRTTVADANNECLGNNDIDNGGDNEDGGNVGPCNCNPSQAPDICRAPGSEGVLVAHEYCNHYYTCNHGKPVSMKCPPGLFYDPYKEKCDWAHAVECGDRVIPEDDGTDNGNGSGEDIGGGESGGDNPGACNCDPGEAPKICAAKGSDGTLIAHENCNQYYVCNHGRPLTMTCPPNLLYNPYTEQCDWPRNVDCGDRIDPNCICDNDSASDECNGNNEGSDNNDGDDSSDGGGGGAGGDTGSGGNGGDGGSGGNSGEIGDDGNGDASGEDGDTGTEGDDGEEDSDSNNEDTCECNCDPNEAANICATPGSQGTLIAHANCNKFYQCANNVPVALTCPGNLLYNPYKQNCDWPHNVNCGDRVIPESDGGNDSDEGDDSNGDSEGDDGNGDSGNGENVSCNCDPTEAPVICAADYSEGVLVAHENCNQFYQCSNGKPTAHPCAPPLLYNPHIEQCDWPSNVECGERLIPEDNGDDSDDSGQGGEAEEDDNDSEDNNNNGCHDDPSLAPEICAAPNSNGILVAHEYCNKFYMCSDSRPITLSCPQDLLFNPSIGACDWPSNVDCGDRIVPDSNDNDNGCACAYARGASQCFKPEMHGVRIVHENCNQFYFCVHGSAVVHTCPDNLVFNERSQVCDWPFFVDCRNRIVTSSFVSTFNKHSASRRLSKV